MSGLKITLGDFDFNTDIADSSGSFWYITAMEGWDSPALRQSFGQPTSRHGGVLLESLMDTRALTLTGVCKATSESAFWTAYNGLLGRTNNLVVPVDLIVYETVPKKCGVIRGGQVRIDIIGGSAFTFEIPLIAPDPLKYSVV